jgi:hypothetical protein
MIVIDAIEHCLRAFMSRAARRWGSALGAALLVPCFAGQALATPEYPAVIDATFGTDCPQLSRCLICHTSAKGGQSTAVQPFAKALRPYGLARGHDGGALQAALMALPATTDSDGDGVPDKDELMVCGNPSGDDLGDGPSYGCDGAHLAARLPDDAPLGIIALLAAGLIVRRRSPAPAAPSLRK